MNYIDIIIKSKRLKLVPIALKHAEDIFTNFTQEVTKYMYPKPADDVFETKAFIEGSLERMKKNNNVQLVIQNKDKGEFIGCVGLHSTDCNTPEFGIWTKKSSHGNGYGREAIQALFNWACENIKFDYILYPVDKRNIPSRNIPKSLGGKVAREFKSINQSGFELDELEYHIYPTKK